MGAFDKGSVKSELEALLNEIEAISSAAEDSVSYVQDEYLELLLNMERQKILIFIDDLNASDANLNIVNLFVRTERDGIWEIKRRLLELLKKGEACMILRRAIREAFSDFIVAMSAGNGYKEAYVALERLKSILDIELREMRKVGSPLIGYHLGVDGIKREPKLWDDGPIWPTEEEFRNAWGPEVETE